MAVVTQPLRDEHKELLPQIETLRLAGDEIAENLSPSANQKITDAYTFLTHHLLPHAQAEERALYPVVQKVMGAPASTSTMSHDHMEVNRLTQELGFLRKQITGTAISVEEANALRRVLYGLYTLVKIHFIKEEEVYLPLLDKKLTPEEAQAMFASMESAAREAKAHVEP